MPIFSYRALTTEGQTSSGTLTAETRQEAVNQIKELDMRPLDVKEGGGVAASAKKSTKTIKSRRSRITSRDVLVFTSQLGALLKAGIVMSHALVILEEQSESGAMADIIGDVRHRIHEGASLSEALGKYPKHFSRLFCSMIRVGESGGVLDVVLKQLASFMESENALRSNILTALAYPLLVVVVGIGSIFMLVGFVIPRLSSVFADFGDKLPLLTRILIKTSDIMLSYSWLILLIIIGLGYGFRKVKNTPKGKETLDLICERLPLIGNMLIKAQIARFSRTMGTLVRSGIPVVQSLNLMVDTTTSSILSRCLREVCDKVQKGQGLATPLKETGFFPPMVTNLIAVGEESGSLDEMLNQVAETYDQEVQHAIKRFITLFEPMVIILMAIGVGGVLFAFLMPILNISSMIN
jgi:type II secretory pathway component PulF